MVVWATMTAAWSRAPEAKALGLNLGDTLSKFVMRLRVSGRCTFLKLQAL